MDSIVFEDFDLDARNYRLRRSGEDVKLERIPLELLLLLADRAGEVVTREEIFERLWGKGVHLDAENAINTAMRKIRLALGDDPAHPRFVQTVSGKGYRFIARIAGPALTTVAPAAEPAGQAGRSETRGRRRYVYVLIISAVCFPALGIVFMLVRWNASLPQAAGFVQITNDGQPKMG